MVDQCGDPVYDVIETSYNEIESDFEYKTRCEQHLKDQQRIWQELVETCEGEPAILLRSVQDHDGTGAWKTLENRYGSISLSTTIALLDQLLDFNPKCKVDLHCTGWKELCRRLHERDIVLLPELESILFLRTLPGRFQSFVTHQKLQTGALENPHVLYQAAIDFDSGKSGADEADLSGKALWGATDARYSGAIGAVPEKAKVARVKVAKAEEKAKVARVVVAEAATTAASLGT
jgi:hypothetical protein